MVKNGFIYTKYYNINTIVSDLDKKIMKGIVFHTQYTGKTMNSLSTNLAQ